MTEQERSHEELEAFRTEIREAIDTNIFIITSGQDEGPFSVDPFSLGLGDETLADLSSEKLSILREELNDLLGRTNETQSVANYQSGEEISVSVFQGNQTDEEGNEQSFFVHEIKHPDGALDWQLSASPDPLF